MATPPPGMPMPGQPPTPQQIQMIQQQLAADAARQGMTVPQYLEQLKARHQQAQQQAAQQQQRQQEEGQGAQDQQMQQQQQQIPIQPGPPKPAAIAVAKFLRSQELKPRTCIFQEKRKDMFKVKRAIRALQSPTYEKARKKNPLLPPVTDRASAENTFKLLPMSLLALRVSKIDPNDGHAGHSHGPKKRVKGLWTVKIEQQQEANDEYHYIWMYEGSQWRQKLYAVLALLLIMAVVMFPLWPLKMRQGVWYLSMGCLGLLGLFFAMSIFRLILFCVTVFVAPPGLWLYPNLFEDVGFFDSFRPLWGWQEDKKTKKKKSKKSDESKDSTDLKSSKHSKHSKHLKKSGETMDAKDSETSKELKESKKSKATPNGKASAASPATDGSIPSPEGAITTGTDTAAPATVQQRNLSARVDEVEDE